MSSLLLLLVIETGVSESLPRLRADADWWFTNSNGAIRIVLLFSIRKASKRVVVEKWQLAPPGTAAPLTTNAINLLRQQQPTPMPPLVQQPAAMQLPYAAQEITIETNQIRGSPLIIPFQALFDRLPQGNEHDIVLGDQDLRSITDSV